MKSVESAIQPEAPPSEPVPQFNCIRHKVGEKYGFTNWQAYIDHCDRFREEPVAEAPVEVIERMMGAPYSCYKHNKTFGTRGLAEMHLKLELQKGGRAVHQTIDQMKITQGKKD